MNTKRTANHQHTNDPTWAAALDVKYAVTQGLNGDFTLKTDFPAAVRPRAVVVLAGSNNIGVHAVPLISDGVRAILQRLSARWPDSRLVLMGEFPRDKAFAGFLHPDTFRINAILRR